MTDRLHDRQSEPASVRLCWKGLHEMTPENIFYATGYARCRACRSIRDKAWIAAHPGHSTPYVRQYRSDPEKAELERERSRSWKKRNREKNRARDRAYKAAQRAAAKP